MTAQEALAAVLRQAREAKGWTLRRVASAVGIDFTSLSKIENGHDRPGDALVRRLCHLYDLDPEPLLLAREVAEVRPDVKAAILAAHPPAPDHTAALRAALEDVCRALVSEHGHPSDAYAPWPSCLPVHIALNRAKDALAAPAPPPPAEPAGPGGGM